MYVEMKSYEMDNGERYIVPTGTYEWRLVANEDTVPTVDVGILEADILSQEQIKRTALATVWDRIWYNTSVERIKVAGVEIEYMDGEIFTINQSQVKHACW